MTLEELGAWLGEFGHPAYRARQILEWIYQRGAESFEQMSNLPKSLRAWLMENAEITVGQIELETLAEDATRKLLIRFVNDARVETVWIPSEDRHTACVSSQVGCPVGCRFCASGMDGVERNLSAAEIVEQAWRIQRRITDVAGESGPSRLSNIVMMGMGEPLANYREVLRALRIINASWGLGIGARKITLSTVGLPKQIRALAEEGLQINLALSLHAPDDALRAEIIPWAERIAIADLLDACRNYFERTGREITLEYVLLAGVNDRPRHADSLARIAKSLRANVNLLRYNPVAGAPYERPSAEAANGFQVRLRQHGVNSHIRRSRGRDANAACGQLRRSAATT